VTLQTCERDEGRSFRRSGFERYDRVKLTGKELALDGFELKDGLTLVAVRSKGKRGARVALDSIEFPGITPIEACWLKASKQFARAYT